MKAAEEQLLIFEGASAGRYPQRSRPSKQRHNDERREPRRSLRSSPKDEPVGRRRGKNRQMASALRVAEITGRGLCWLGTYSPLRGCSCQAALPAASSFRNGLYAIKSAIPLHERSASGEAGNHRACRGVGSAFTDCPQLMRRKTASPAREDARGRWRGCG
jgi:hypothetical protein